VFNFWTIFYSNTSKCIHAFLRGKHCIFFTKFPHRLITSVDVFFLFLPNADIGRTVFIENPAAKPTNLSAAAWVPAVGREITYSPMFAVL